jgi:hypothetical protein
MRARTSLPRAGADGSWPFPANLAEAHALIIRRLKELATAEFHVRVPSVDRPLETDDCQVPARSLGNAKLQLEALSENRVTGDATVGPTAARGGFSYAAEVAVTPSPQMAAAPSVRCRLTTPSECGTERCRQPSSSHLPSRLRHDWRYFRKPLFKMNSI